MRGRPFQLSAITRAAGYAIVAAAAIAAASLHFRHDAPSASATARMPTNGTDPLAPELARCQSLGMAAKDDVACEAAWAENRRRFFTYSPAAGATNAPAEHRPLTGQEVR